jgi:thioredoxin 1
MGGTMLTEICNFDSEIRKFPEMLALFYADWCGHCESFRPIFKEIAQSCRTTTAMIDISDEDNPLWDALGINAVPTMILYRNGKIIDRVTGSLKKGELDAFMKKNGLG